MKKYVCPVCGYVHEGNEPPEKCPQCGVPGSKFTVMEEGTALNFVCEHVIGVGAKDQVEADVYEGLKANFEGECTEVGMYIAMSRQAIREGYPEIGEFYMRAALEAVSYTHLDVYKRQTHTSRSACCSTEFTAVTAASSKFICLFAEYFRNKCTCTNC